jgi:hypothetical protein
MDYSTRLNYLRGPILIKVLVLCELCIPHMRLKKKKKTLYPHMPPKSKLHKWECPTGWLVRLCSQYAHYRFNIFSPFFVILILYIILPTWPNGCRVHFNYNVMELDHLAIDKFQISIPCVFELGHQLGPNELV